MNANATPKPVTQSPPVERLDRSDHVVLLENGGHTAPLLFTDPVETLELTAGRSIESFLADADDARREGYYVAGYLNYEALAAKASGGESSAPCAWLGLYRRPSEVKPGSLNYDFTNFSLEPQTESNDKHSESQRFYAAIAEIKKQLRQGNCYQINYTQELTYRFSGSPLQLYCYLRNQQQAAWCAYVKNGNHSILSFSPELFFRIRQNSSNSYSIETRPVKGTAPRSRNPEVDQKLRAELSHSEKTIAENSMITDLLRNDLGRIARVGSVQVDDFLKVETLPTFHQMHSVVSAELSAATESNLFSQIFPALFPSGSVTGAPKVAAQRIIDSLEKRRRGIYTGSIGYAGPLNSNDKERSSFNVAIRSLEIESATGQARFGCGCGIVWDSVAEDEYHEFKLKSSFLKPAHTDFHLIETMLLEEGRLHLWKAHLERLKNGLKQFSIPYQRQELQRELRRLLQEKPQGSWRVRLTVNRRGEVNIESSPADWSFAPSGLYLKKIRLKLAEQPIWSGDFFRRYKTNNRRELDDEFQAAQKSGHDDVLFYNERGEITETATGNLLLLDERGRWLTPAAECGLLSGTYLESLRRRHPGRVESAKIKLHQMSRFKSVLVCNSVRGLRRVASITPEKE